MSTRPSRGHSTVDIPGFPEPDLWEKKSPAISPPGSFNVETERKPVLYLPDGTALIRRPIGFPTGRQR